MCRYSLTFTLSDFAAEAQRYWLSRRDTRNSILTCTLSRPRMTSTSWKTSSRKNAVAKFYRRLRPPFIFTLLLNDVDEERTTSMTLTLFPAGRRSAARRARAPSWPRPARKYCATATRRAAASRARAHRKSPRSAPSTRRRPTSKSACAARRATPPPRSVCSAGARSSRAVLR